MRAFKGITKFAAYKRLGGKKGVEEMSFMASLKPGDLINGCSHWPFNTRVKGNIKIERASLSALGSYHTIKNRNFKVCKGSRRNPSGFYVNGVSFEDIYGYYHCYPGGGCVERPLTVKQIRDIVASWAPSEEALRQAEIEAKQTWLSTKELPPEELAKIEKSVAIWCRVRDGLPICDEYGIKLDELR